MNKHILSIAVLAAGGAMIVASACGHRGPQSHATATAEPAAQTHSGEAAQRSHQEKTYAPVELKLTTSASSGQVEVVLSVTALADLPNALARIVLPEGVTLLSAEAQSQLGAIAKGQTASFSARAMIPADGAYTLAGGVEVKVSEGVQLAKSAVVQVGAAHQAAPAKIIALPEGGSVRLGD
ncbi:MAG: hypothetical protein R3F39_09530 [Myxococcota bacterium]